MTISAKIIADSISEEGNRLTTMQLVYPRFIHAEFMTHRMFCLGGDSRLDFELPVGKRDGGRRVYSMTISEFVDKWHNGAASGRASRHNGVTLAELDDLASYSARAIATSLGHKRALNLNDLCRKGVISSAIKYENQWFALGCDWKKWRATTGRRRFSIQSRLRKMRIRQVDENSGAVVTANVTDCCFSGVKEVFRLSAGNYSVVATVDHMILTDEGWMRLGAIAPGKTRVSAYRYGTGANEDKYKKIDGQWVSRWSHTIRQSVADRQGGVCANTGTPLGSVFHIHHVVPRHRRPDLAFDTGNVIAVTPDEHRRIHSTQGWQEGAPLISGFVTVDSIEYEGEQPTYDLSISGDHANFFADGVVVHNSRNASSSRAIPVAKMIETVRTNPAMPIHWGANQPGMQARAELDDNDKVEAELLWYDAAAWAAHIAEEMSFLGLHKQVVNRILEPFQHIHVVVTATEWENFFNLRCHPDAQPEMQALARAMSHCHGMSISQILAPGEWHLPYVSTKERLNHTTADCIKMSAARCARVSYLTHDGKTPDFESDIKLYNQLTTAIPPHMSPVEHQAMAVPSSKFFANFRGWMQHRWDLENNT